MVGGFASHRTINAESVSMSWRRHGWQNSWLWPYQGLCSLNGKTSYRQISRSIGAARLDVIMIVSLWNLTGISAALLPTCLYNFRAINKVYTWFTRFRDFKRSCGKTSYRLVKRGPYMWSELWKDVPTYIVISSWYVGKHFILCIVAQ